MRRVLLTFGSLVATLLVVVIFSGRGWAGGMLTGFACPPLIAFGRTAFWGVPFLKEWRTTAMSLTFVWFVIGWVTAAGAVGWHMANGAAWSWVLASFIKWWRGPRRKRAEALLGEKSRALRDAVVRRAREAAQPRRVLRPVTGAA